MKYHSDYFKKDPKLDITSPVEQLLLLVCGHDDVLGHQLVLRDVDQELALQELLQNIPEDGNKN